MPEEKNEIREDFLGRKVVIASSRGKRPKEFAVEEKKEGRTLPEKCFFCPGNEHLTPPEIDRIEVEKGKWQIRCFPNKFPALAKEFPDAYGTHEIIVETPDHYKTLSQLSVDNILNMFELFKRRIKETRKDKKIRYLLVFKNEGREAGASLEHTHHQLTSLAHVPSLAKREIEASKSPCKFCGMPEKEKERTIVENEHIVAFVPYASRFPFEVRILPKRHVRCMTDMKDDELKALGETLKTILEKIDGLLNYPSYNMVYHIAPFDDSEFHFHIEVMPKLVIWAGFEFGTDMIMTSMPPERAAEALRKQ